MDFDLLIDQYQRSVYNLIYRLTGDREDAADLTQETFVAAYKALDNFRGDCTVRMWLCRIAVNKCKNKFRLNDRRRAYEAFSLDDPDKCAEDLIGSGSKTYRLDDEVESKELKNMVEQAIIQLPYDYKIVAVLRDLQGFSYEEIAQAADLSVDVVRTRLARARAMLRRKLEPYLKQE